MKTAAALGMGAGKSWQAEAFQGRRQGVIS